MKKIEDNATTKALALSSCRVGRVNVLIYFLALVPQLALLLESRSRLNATISTPGVSHESNGFGGRTDKKEGKTREGELARLRTRLQTAHIFLTVGNT